MPIKECIGTLVSFSQIVFLPLYCYVRLSKNMNGMTFVYRWILHCLGG